LVVGCLPWTLSLVHDPIARAALVLIGFGTLAAALVFLAVGVQHLRVLERWWLTRISPPLPAWPGGYADPLRERKLRRCRLRFI
jgi:hypothetical protein